MLEMMFAMWLMQLQPNVLLLAGGAAGTGTGTGVGTVIDNDPCSVLIGQATCRPITIIFQSFSTCNVSGEWVSGNWSSLVALALLVILLFLSIAYMLGTALRRADWLQWAKDEFYQLIISGVIASFFILFAQLACNVSASLAGADPFQTASVFLQDLAWQKTLTLATNMYASSIYSQLTATFFVPLGSTKTGSQPFAGFNLYASLFDFMFGIASMIFSSLLLQDMVLKIVQSLSIKVLLPIGVFLRVFPFLRQAGATMIALALGFYIVFPMMYVLDYQVLKAVPPPSFSLAIDSNSIATLGDNAFSNAFASGIYPLAQASHLAYLIPYAFFLPLLNILVTLAFVKSMTKVLSQNFPSPFE